MLKSFKVLLVLLAISSLGLAISGTQVGRWSKVYWSTGHAFEKGGAERTETYQITFQDEFDTVPDVAVGLYGFDLSYQRAGVRVFAKDITERGFTLLAIAPADCAVYFFGVSWLATTSNQINIGYKSQDQTQADFKACQNSGSNYRFCTSSQRYKNALTNPVVISVFNGFITTANNIRVQTYPSEVDGNGFTLNQGCWADTGCYAVDSVWIAFEKTNSRLAYETQSQYATGPLFGNAGGISQADNVGDTNSLVWFGVHLFDAMNGRNYRINQDYSRVDTTLKINSQTWADTAIYMLKNYVFVTPNEYTYPQTQTGRFTKTYWSTGHIFEKDASKERTQLLKVNYVRPFAEVPRVAVALTGFDLNLNNAGVKIEVVKASTTFFICKVTAPKDALVYFVGVAYIATLSPRIQFATIDKTNVQPELDAAVAGDGTKWNTHKMKSPVTLPSPGAVSFLAGFQFTGGANIRLRTWVESAAPEFAVVKAGTWADTNVRSYTVTVVFFEKSSKQGTAELQTDIYSGVQSQSKAITVYPRSEFFVAASSLDFIAGHNFRLSQTFTLKNDQLTANFKTWADTQLYLVKDAVFYAETYRPGILTQTGRTAKTYWATGHIFERDRSTERTDEISITFATPFDYTPQVAVALNGVDLSYSNAAVRVVVKSVSLTGFTFTIVAPLNSLVYWVGVSWIATVSDKIQIKTISLDQARKDFSIGTSGERTLNNVVALDGVNWGSTGAAIVFSGFRFTDSGNIRLRTSVTKATSSQIEYMVGTWADTQWQGVDLTVVAFAADDSKSGVVQVDTSTTGALYGGSGGRSEVKSVNVNSGSELFIGLRHFDCIFGRNYRLSQSPALTGNKLDITFNTWADTMVWLSSDYVFYTNGK